MPQIVTLTPNPAVDLSTAVERVFPSLKLRCAQPRRDPGGGGAPEIAASCREVIVVMRQRLRAFVSQVDFVTSVGHGSGPGDRGRLGLRGAGPVRVITDLGVLEPDPGSAELVLTAVHPDITIEQVRSETGWELEISPDLKITAPPTEQELSTLRGLRTVGAS